MAKERQCFLQHNLPWAKGCRQPWYGVNYEKLMEPKKKYTLKMSSGNS
jgi:hypothetical protein